MTQVHNWQLGREMSYPFEEAHPDRQLAAVFNLNRCIGCQTCTMACKSTWTFSKGQEQMWWNNVETKPYGGYPQFWDVKILKLLEEEHEKQGGQMAWSEDEGGPYGKYEGMTIFEAADKRYGPEGPQRALGYLPADHEWTAPNIYEDTTPNYEGGELGISKEGSSLPEHKAWFFYLARTCNHCTYPACVAACPRKAIYKRKEDGIVLIDQDRCRGYRKCVEACPYKKSYYRPNTRTSEKCVGCVPLTEGADPIGEGHPVESRCMTACVGKIRLQSLVKINQETGDWADDPEHPLYFLVKKEKIALPLYPQFGLEPNLYYIPPRWAPRPYLRQMFGPGVDDAIAKYTAPSRELLAVLQLFRAHRLMIFKYGIKKGEKLYETKMPDGRTVEVFNDTVIGYGQDGRKIVETPVVEPIHKRTPDRLNTI
ncbi:MAG: 4Fe-4S dicluster domain-containing protein [Armatimonadetes bacterium]|nr:4Fe-4S dicluster domain-containing protein [Armatimonadota bacterium]